MAEKFDVVRLYVSATGVNEIYGEVRVRLGERVTEDDLWELESDELEKLTDIISWGDGGDGANSDLCVEDYCFDMMNDPCLRVSRNDEGDLTVGELLTPCPDCGAAVGAFHLDDCDIERCTACGSQRISCGCDPPATRRDEWLGSLEIPGTRK